MEKEIAFQILGLEETKEEAVIQAAYRDLLKSTNPEDDPDGFKRLRLALDTAMEHARETDSNEEEDGPKTEVDLWIDRIVQNYENLKTRHSLEAWDTLLNDPICEELDTSLEAREKMLIFLMNHIHLPHKIWQKIDETFEYVDDMENLKQDFPENFLDYVKYYVEHETFFPYEYFEPQDTDADNVKGDSYIDGLMSVKGRIDNNITEGCMQELDDLSAFHVYHPYEDIERLRLYTLAEDIEKCRQTIDLLNEKIPTNQYALVHIGEAYWIMDRKEEAYSIWKGLLEKEPDFYLAKYNVVRYLMEQKDYYQARELMHDLLDQNGNDTQVQKMLQDANNILIPEYQGKLERGEEDEHFPGGELLLELGWCLFQNDRIEEAIALLESATPESTQEYGYYNLFGRLLYQNQQYERALPLLQKWRDMLWELKEDGTEETKKRITRKNMAASMLGACHYELGQREKALECIEEAIKVAADSSEWLGSMQQLAGLLLQYKEYEQTVDTCDRLLQRDAGYYPAYLLRQEACFELKKGQEVVDDYHRAIDIYPQFYRPYMFAAEVFFFYSQYEDGMEVLNLAQKNGVELTPRMLLYKAKILRNLANSSNDRKEIFEIIESLINLPRDDNYDIEDASEPTFEKALLFWDEDNLKKAYLYIKKAIEQNPKRLQYRLVCGNINLDRGRYNEALQNYKEAEPEYNDSPSLYYGRGLCYEGLGTMPLAMECFQKALEFHSTYADACEKVSEYFNRQYHRTYKREYLNKALAYATQQLEETENCYYLVNRGLIYMNALELEQAVADFEKALTYREDDWPAWNNLGCCYKYMGNFEKAIECLEQAVKYMDENKDILPYSNMADCYEALGKYENAITCYRKDLEILPDDIDFWSEIGDLYYYMGKFQQALDAYEHTNTRKARHKDYFRNIGNVWIKKGDRRKGIGYYKKGIHAVSGQERADKYYELGQLYTNELREFKKAIYCFKQAMNLTNDYDDWFDYARYTAKAYYFMGDKANAKKFALRAFSYFESARMGTQEEYINYKPFTPVRLGIFGWLYLCIGDEKKAEYYFQKMGKICRCKQCRFRKCYENTLYMGDLYLTKGDTKMARKAYEETLARNPHCDEAISALKRMENNNDSRN